MKIKKILYIIIILLLLLTSSLFADKQKQETTRFHPKLQFFQGYPAFLGVAGSLWIKNILEIEGGLGFLHTRYPFSITAASSDSLEWYVRIGYPVDLLVKDDEVFLQLTPMIGVRGINGIITELFDEFCIFSFNCVNESEYLKYDFIGLEVGVKFTPLCMFLRHFGFFQQFSLSGIFKLKGAIEEGNKIYRNVNGNKIREYTKTKDKWFVFTFSISIGIVF